MIVRPLNGLMDKGHQGIGDGDPSLAWLTPHQAPIPCLPQLGNMPQAPALVLQSTLPIALYYLRLPLIQAAALPTGINVTCIPAHRAQGPLRTSADF